MTVIPNIITHNFDPRRGAFRNICALPDARAEAILDELRAAGTGRIKADYLALRRATEDWLIAEAAKKLDGIGRAWPIYFFLGDFADGLDPARPRSLVMPMAAFAPDMLTFTYPDSMASLPFAKRGEHLGRRQPYHGRVFTLAEIKQVVAEYALPLHHDSRGRSRRVDSFIEVQVWNDAPIRHFLEGT